MVQQHAYEISVMSLINILTVRGFGSILSQKILTIIEILGLEIGLVSFYFMINVKFWLR